MRNTLDAYDTLETFITERATWFRFGVIENEHHGFDIVLRLDGTYRQEADAWRVAAHLRRRFAAVLSAGARRQWFAYEDRSRATPLGGRGTWSKEP
jgi:hypothetical protein